MIQAAFCANRCNVCFFTKSPQPERLLLCSRCLMIRYCGPEHQALDWPIHRDFCESIEHFLQERQIKHISHINGEIHSPKDFENAIVIAKSAVRDDLQRSLEQHEIDLITFPKLCHICFTYDVNNEFDCDHCKVAAYCCKEHKDRDAEKHSKICHLLMVYSQFYSDESFYLPFEFTKSIDHREEQHLFDVLQKSCKNGICIPKEPQRVEDYQAVCYASNFSCIATIVYAMNLRRITKPFPDPLVIYIVGAEQEYMFFEQEQLLYFFNHLPSLRTVVLRFIGPQVARSMEYLQRSFSIQRREFSAKASFHSIPLEDYLEHYSEGEVPNVIACFNCGFCEFENTRYNPWRAALNSMLQLKGATILFTSYTLGEAKSDIKLLTDIASEKSIPLDLTLLSKDNPYKDYRPFRNWEVSDEIDPIYFRNGYLNVLGPMPVN